ncbi:unnamed protein product [Polarella glacialis]|uniref:Uncharacterized protein n=1 Tax=Polarella glacialis TaxID=89957 RepID=A0A813LS07_POLGL|nr:unnamed protein product [Polarella glacialis]
MEGDSQAQEASLGPEAHSWENFRTLAMEDDARLGMELAALPTLSIGERRAGPLSLNSYLERRQEYDLDKLRILDRLLLAPCNAEDGVGAGLPVRIIALNAVEGVRWSRKGFLEGIGNEGRRGQLIRVTSRSWAVWTAVGWHPADLGELSTEACQRVNEPVGPSPFDQTVTRGGFPHRPEPDPVNFWDGQILKLYFRVKIQDDHRPNWTRDLGTRIGDMSRIGPLTSIGILNPGSPSRDFRRLSWQRLVGSLYPQHWYQAAQDQAEENAVQDWIFHLEEAYAWAQQGDRHTMWRYLLSLHWFDARRCGMSLWAREDRGPFLSNSRINKFVGYFTKCIRDEAQSANAAIPWYIDNEGHDIYQVKPAAIGPLTPKDFPVDLIVIADCLGTGIHLLALSDMVNAFRSLFKVTQVLTTESNPAMTRISDALAPPALLFPAAIHRHYARTADLILDLPNILSPCTTSSWTSPTTRAAQMVIGASGPPFLDCPHSGLDSEGHGIHGRASAVAFDVHRLLVLLASELGPHRYLWFMEHVSFTHDQDQQEFSAMFGPLTRENAADFTGVHHKRTYVTYPGLPPGPSPWIQTWGTGDASLPLDCTYPTRFLEAGFSSGHFAQPIERGMHHGNYALPELRPLLLDLHSEHLDKINLINLAFDDRSEREQFEVLAGYIQHATLGPVFWPRPWLASKCGLDRFELARLNAALPCTSNPAGFCATVGNPFCANCALLTLGLSQASHKKLAEGCLKRLVALWTAGRTDAQSKVEGHTLPIHICGAACTHKRKARPTDRMLALTRRRSYLEPRPQGWKWARIQ